MQLILFELHNPQTKQMIRNNDSWICFGRSTWYKLEHNKKWEYMKGAGVIHQITNMNVIKSEQNA